eukprot:362011-Chlamydomonas_euryale.AAC.13
MRRLRVGNVQHQPTVAPVTPIRTCHQNLQAVRVGDRFLLSLRSGGKGVWDEAECGGSRDLQAAQIDDRCLLSLRSGREGVLCVCVQQSSVGWDTLWCGSSRHALAVGVRQSEEQRAPLTESAVHWGREETAAVPKVGLRLSRAEPRSAHLKAAAV